MLEHSHVDVLMTLTAMLAAAACVQASYLAQAGHPPAAWYWRPLQQWQTTTSTSKAARSRGGSSECKPTGPGSAGRGDRCSGS